MNPVVMDASALIVLARKEPGVDKVRAALPFAVVAAPNWAEALRQLELKLGWTFDQTNRTFCSVGLKVEPVTEDDAEVAAHLDRPAENKDLSLADRFCLAVAERLEGRAYTSDQPWATANTTAEVVMIR